MHIRWRGLELPGKVTCDQESLTATYGKFTAEPFERGFGSTIGNSLRRVLLSSLEGSAVTQVAIKGANHEFATIEGVYEDVTDIILNVKSLVVKNHSSTPSVIIVEKKGVDGEMVPVTGADIETDQDVEVINKDHVIATLTKAIDFKMEMIVENGRGYVPASEQQGQDHQSGIIFLDAVYSPVRRVRYEVEETRVKQKTNYDRLVLEIWTDGAITPEMALVEAAKILRKHLNPFVQYSELGPRVHAQGRGGSTGIDPVLEAKLKKPLAELNLSGRAHRCLDQEGIVTVGDLVQRTEDELLMLKSFGEASLNEVKEKLEALGLHLGMKTLPVV